jgi:hypothetical protein
VTNPGGEASAEFRLLAACCRWPTDAEAVRAAASDSIDWYRFLVLARRHRVVGFARRGLVAAGIDPPRSITALSRRVAAQNLLLAREARRITQLLAGAGISAAFLKGATLAERAYRDQGIKQSIDNDILVAPDDVVATVAVLERAGYRLESPAIALNPARLAVMTDLVKECLFVHARNGASIDLHWRTTSLRGLLKEPDLATDQDIVTVDGDALPTLKVEALMTYLAVHGAAHGWSRLKWLADFNALLAPMSEAEVTTLRGRAQRDGAPRAMTLALLQANRVFGTPVPADVGRSRRVRWLAALSDALMRSGERAGQGEVPKHFTALILASTLLLKARPRYLADAAWTAWVAPPDALAVPLPRALYPLYALISPTRRIGRLTARGFARLQSRTTRAAKEN